MKTLMPQDAVSQRLLAEVHPSEWINPEPGSRYDLVVVGGGTGGLVSAIGAAGVGARVALVERGLLGGDCLNTGCVPSKAILRSARAAADARRAEALGVRVSTVEPDFDAVMGRMRERRADIGRHDSAARLHTAGVDVYFGEARFTGPSTLELNASLRSPDSLALRRAWSASLSPSARRHSGEIRGQAGERRTLEFRRAVIATGGRPAVPPIPGLSTVAYLTNETLFSLNELPRRLVIIGAGPVGCEMAQALARLGSDVTLVDEAPQVLPHEDADAAAIVASHLTGDRIAIELGVKVTDVVQRGDDVRLRIEGAGGAREVTCDRLLVATGRTPNIEVLGLPAAGVAFDAAGVIVDDWLRTSNRRIFAAGDVCSRFKFTHAADAMARIVVQNALFFGRKRASTLVIPWCTYTDPEVAHVGMYEEDARRQGRRVETITIPLERVDRAIVDEERDGFVRVHHERGRLLGCTVVSSRAGEVIGVATHALTHGASLTDLGSTIHPYPTHHDAFRMAGDAYRRSRLTPWIRAILKRYFRLM